MTRRLLLAAGAVLATLALCEAALRLVLRGERARMLASRRGGAGDGPTILCAGDSYTFGVYYRAEESYPGRLEQILRALQPDDSAPFVVANTGIPAQNLAQLAARLPEQLEQLRPRAVIVLGGFNDRWNFAAPREQGRLARWWNGLALVRLARLATVREEAPAQDARARLHHLAADQIVVDTDEGAAAIDVAKTGRRLEPDELATTVTQRLEEIVALVRAAGAVPILASYPSPEPGFAVPSEAAAEVAARLEVPFVDLRGAFAEQLDVHRYDELFIPGDRHPTDRGYWRMAVLVARALVRAGVVEAEPELAAALESAPEHDYALPGFDERLWPLRLVRIGADPAWLELAGPPEAAFRLLVASSTEPPQRFGSLELRLAADDLFRRSVADAQLSGRFDRAGSARVSLPLEYSAGGRFVALAVLHDLPVAAADLSVRGVVGPLDLAAPR